MKVLVLGSGAREHAIAWKLSASSRIEGVYVGPGNAGTAECATNLPDVEVRGFDTILSACRSHSIDCVFVGPEVPLAAGVVDFLAGRGIHAIGPRLAAARLESSKSFSKAFLRRNEIPTARAAEFSDPMAFEAYVRAHPGARMVIKKSGLAAGKGVFEATATEELIKFGREILDDDTLLVEEFLEGWEVSIFGVSDGAHHIILPECTDFKKAGEGDRGPNTGGMGSICPVPWVDAELRARIQSEIVKPTYAALDREGIGYTGILYFGLMVTSEGPKVLEFNVRLGDPETQVLLPVLDLDFGALVEAMVSGTLEDFEAPTDPGSARKAALGVVIASKGYPESYQKNVPVSALPASQEGTAMIFHASTRRDEGGTILTGGGRCFTVVGIGSDLHDACRKAYEMVERVRVEGSWYRRDIGGRFL